MGEAVKLLLPQIADQAGVDEALDVRIEIAGKKAQIETSPRRPGIFGQAKNAASQGEEGGAADGVGPLSPDDSTRRPRKLEPWRRW